MHRLIRVLLMMVPMALTASVARADELDKLAADFWSWRAATQPFTSDDIPRLDRPTGWRADWSPRSFDAQRKGLLEFESRWKKLEAASWPVPRQADYCLMGSAIERVRWELEVTRGWRRNALFYVQQTMGAVHILLLRPKLDGDRGAEILRRMKSIPQTLEHARTNLDEARGPFARLAIEELKDVRARLETVARNLKPELAPESAAKLDGAAEHAIVALEAYREWLQKRLPSLPQGTAVGRDAYVFFLKNVALIPYAPEQLLAMGRQELERAVAFEAYERNRNAEVPPLALLASQAEQRARQERDELAVRRFLEEKNILTVPSWMKHYRERPLPAYVQPLESMGVPDDLTGPSRLDEDGISWFPPPGPDLGYFELANARDPRVGIVHEGVHYMQLVFSWAHEDPIRRHYYDSGANEGIAFYNEELMLQAGLFDDSPHTREIIYNMMRLRALRVEVDVKLALGLFTIEQGAEYLRTAVPMDAHTAASEAAFFAAIPGQAITYQIGKLQILRFLADARRKQGDAFRLRAFHDFVWKNGNVPLVLQRWEYLGARDDVDALERLK